MCRSSSRDQVRSWKVLLVAGMKNISQKSDHEWVFGPCLEESPNPEPIEKCYLVLQCSCQNKGKSSCVFEETTAIFLQDQ